MFNISQGAFIVQRISFLIVSSEIRLPISAARVLLKLFMEVYFWFVYATLQQDGSIQYQIWRRKVHYPVVEY